MSFIARFINQISGNTIPQEYVSLQSSVLTHPFRLFLTMKGNQVFYDVTGSHILLGYKPLIIGIFFNDVNVPPLNDDEEVCVSFVTGEFDIDQKWKGFPTSSASRARLILQSNSHRVLWERKFFLFIGRTGNHQFLTFFQQWTNRLFDSLKAIKKGNIFLPGNLYDQVRIGYSVPREISIITVGNSTVFNMFPTDLHGRVGAEGYVGSLRIGGKACEQVEEFKRICLSSVLPAWHARAHALGKNHMRDLHVLAPADVYAQQTVLFKLPLPVATSAYYELVLRDHTDVGIHRIMFYDIVHQQDLVCPPSRLMHVHRYYLAWRKGNGFATDYVLR